LTSFNVTYSEDSLGLFFNVLLKITQVKTYWKVIALKV